MKLFETPINPGTSRHVFMFKHFVIKVSRISAWFENRPSFARFRLNLYLTRHERKNIIRNKGVAGIPKIYFSDPFGFIIVMKRYRDFESSEQYERLYNELLNNSELPKSFWENDACMPNFGLDENNQIVKIDLG